MDQSSPFRNPQWQWDQLNALALRRQEYGGVLDQLGIVPPQQDTPDRNGMLDRLGQGFALADYYAMGIPTTVAGLVNSAIPGQPLGDMWSIKDNAETARNDLSRNALGRDFLALPEAFGGMVPGGVGHYAVPGNARALADTTAAGARQAGRLADAAIDPIYQAMPSNSVGMFGGNLAAENLAKTGETRPLQALQLAERMEQNGASPSEIWRATSEVTKDTPYAGVHRAADGQLKFEASDDLMTLTPRQRDGLAGYLPRRPQRGIEGPYLDHPVMAQMYPEMSSSTFTHTVAPGRDVQGATQGGWLHIEGPPNRPSDLLDVAAHELTHAGPQRLEDGFAPGGSPATMKGHALYKNYGPFAEDQSYDMYRSLKGEVEAENVAARRTMTPDERRAVPPWETQSKRYANQIDIPTTPEYVVNRLVPDFARKMLGLDRLGTAKAEANLNAMEAIDKSIGGNSGGRGKPGAALKGISGGQLGRQYSLPNGDGSSVGKLTPDHGITAYHGSPHDFDRFSMDKIGTGEGAQAYGHGLYFAEAEGVAKSYRDDVSKWHSTMPRVDGALPSDDAMSAAASLVKSYGGVDDAIAARQGHIRDGLPSATERIYREDIANLQKLKESGASVTTAPQQGRMYEVRINADPADFLDWDKPLSQQSEKVRGALADVSGYFDNNPNTKEAIRKLQMDWGGPMFSQAEFDKRGIPGIKYLDQGSRTSGEGSRNYVVFRDDIIDIVKKYGVAFATSLFGLDQVMQATNPQNALATEPQ